MSSFLSCVPKKSDHQMAIDTDPPSISPEDHFKNTFKLSKLISFKISTYV